MTERPGALGANDFLRRGALPRFVSQLIGGATALSGPARGS
jgi:hypothetical protein